MGAEPEGIQDTEARRPAPEAERQARIRPGASEGSSERAESRRDPANTLLSDLQPPERGEYISVVLSAPVCGCYSDSVIQSCSLPPPPPASHPEALALRARPA